MVSGLTTWSALSMIHPILERIWDAMWSLSISSHGGVAMHTQETQMYILESYYGVMI